MMLFKVSLVLFLVGGALVTFGQAAGILLGNQQVVIWLGEAITPPTCVVAGVAGLLAFVNLYVRQKDKEPEPVPAD